MARFAVNASVTMDRQQRFRRLTEAEETYVYETVRLRGNPRDIIAKNGDCVVTRLSLKTLAPGEWLNDEVMNYFYSVLKKRSETRYEQGLDTKMSHFFTVRTDSIKYDA